MYYLIINPASQSGNDQSGLVRRMEESLAAKGKSCQLLYTAKAGDAERFAAEITGKSTAEEKRDVQCKTSMGGNAERKTVMSRDAQCKSSMGVNVGCMTDGNRAGEREKVVNGMAGGGSEGGPSDQDTKDTIVVIGGDGTINGVINGIRDFSRVKFGFIPAGSANDFARGLGIPDISQDRRQDENIQKIAEGKVIRTIDLGEIRYDSKGDEESVNEHSRLFAVSAGIGFDAGVCHESDISRVRGFFNALHLGALTYGTIALKQLITTPEAKCDITMMDGNALHIGKLVFATFMNTPFEGGGYKFAPDAVPDDGMINVSAIGDLSKLTVLVNFPSAHKGTYYKVRGVYHSKAAGMEVCTGQPLWVHTDGEVIGSYSHFSIRCIPHVLNMII